MIKHPCVLLFEIYTNLLLLIEHFFNANYMQTFIKTYLKLLSNSSWLACYSILIMFAHVACSFLSKIFTALKIFNLKWIGKRKIAKTLWNLCWSDTHSAHIDVAFLEYNSCVVRLNTIICFTLCTTLLTQTVCYCYVKMTLKCKLKKITRHQK